MSASKYNKSVSFIKMAKKFFETFKEKSFLSTNQANIKYNEFDISPEELQTFVWQKEAYWPNIEEVSSVFDVHSKYFENLPFEYTQLLPKIHVTTITHNGSIIQTVGI